MAPLKVERSCANSTVDDPSRSTNSFICMLHAWLMQDFEKSGRAPGTRTPTKRTLPLLSWSWWATVSTAKPLKVPTRALRTCAAKKLLARQPRRNDKLREGLVDSQNLVGASLHCPRLDILQARFWPLQVLMLCMPTWQSLLCKSVSPVACRSPQNISL